MGRRKTDLQLDLFDFSEDKYIINKPVRLIEMFAGIGFTRMGISRVFPNLESWRICEWGIPSILGYDAVHNGEFVKCDIDDKDWLVNELYRLGISSNYDDPAKKESIARMPLEKLQQIYSSIKRTNNLVNIMNTHGDDLNITDTDKFCYVLTWSFPCQDLSLAGDKRGMEVSQADGGTRSGLWHEVIRLLKECKEKPQVLIMENVIQIHSVENLPAFLRVQDELSKLGYANFWQDLNGTDYGVPQNRVRTFMVSILDKNAVYSFPDPEPLKKKLLDVLEDNVDEKYYLSKKLIEFFTFNTQQQAKKGNGFKFDPIDSSSDKVAKTITTRNGTRNGTRMDDNFIKIKNNTQKGYLEAKIGDGIDISGRMEHHRGTVQKGIAQTLTCAGGASVGVVVEKSKNE